MSEEAPFIKDGIFNAYYDLLSSKEAVQSYFEVDLGELNYINTRFAYFKIHDRGKKAPVQHSDLEKKTWVYQDQAGHTVPVLPVLKDVEITGYNTIDDVIRDYNILFPLLLEKGFFLQGTKVAKLYSSTIPFVDHTDFDFFFASKLSYVSRNLSLIDPFLDFQLQRFLDAGKTVMDFKRFLKLNVREYAGYFKLRKEAVETVDEWLARNDQKKTVAKIKDEQKYPGWTKSMAILVKAFKNVNDHTFIISDQTRTCEAFALFSGYSPRTISDHVGYLGRPRKFVKSDFLQAERFLKNAIRELDKLAETATD